MKEIAVQDAVGQVLGHDITEIVRDEFKGARFKKGHVIQEEDIEVLLRIGKKHVYVFELEEGMIHEDEAAGHLRDMALGANMEASHPSEGKIDIYASIDGLFKVDISRLYQVNSDPEMMIASRHNNMPVKEGDKLLGTRVIPLVIEEKKLLDKKAQLGPEPIFQLLPFSGMKAGVINTGSELADGLIEDAFTPVIIEKCKTYNIKVTDHAIVTDDKDLIYQEIQKMLDTDLDMIILTGGMSVDPDDKTPAAITKASKDLVTYGTPVLPGAMFCLGYAEADRPIIGVPGCAMYARSTILDLILPRLAAKDLVKAEEIASLGHGGLCLECKVCTYPECSFGKGG